MIKLPLGVHRKYGSRSAFFRIADGVPSYTDGIEENLSILEEIIPVSVDLIQASGQDFVTADGPTERQRFWPKEPLYKRPMFDGTAPFLLEQCHAMGSILQKAMSEQALSRSEAFHFANTMLSIPDGEAIIHQTMIAAFGDRYDPRQTTQEISRIKELLPTSCRLLVHDRICSGYCRESVAQRNEDDLLPNTTPCSVFFRRASSFSATVTHDTVRALADPNIIERAYYRLKRYHEYEDTLFYDPFDFEMMGSELGAVSQVLTVAFEEHLEIPLAGLLPVKIPKKLDDALTLQYRTMSYSTVYDQLPIQSVFDIIGPAIEQTLQASSYGYRWNLESSDPTRIFEDWREAYPRFRSRILSAMQRNPSGYHVCCDIKGFYDHVGHAILLEQLRPIIQDEYTLEFVRRVITMYHSESEDEAGLPQGPAYARLLANLYLNDFDIFAKQIADAYFRYVDDFFLFFDSEESARLGLDSVVVQLKRIGLDLSDDPRKVAVVEPNTDSASVHRTLDKIQYGILESTHQIKHLETQSIVDFYNAVDRQRVTPNNVDQLIAINDDLPTLLYVVCQDTPAAQELRAKLLRICRFLVEKDWFCPKRLKIVFYRLLQIETDCDNVMSLFASMRSAHKAYMLLSAYGLWKNDEDHQEMLLRLVAKAMDDEDAFVMGFAIAIASDLQMQNADYDQVLSTIVRVSGDISWFAAIRLFGALSYIDFGPEARSKIRDLMQDSMPHLARIVMLHNLRELPQTYVDQIYIRGILSEFSWDIVPAAARLIALAEDYSEVFVGAIRFASLAPSFKSTFISLVKASITDLHAGDGRAQIRNLIALYSRIQQDEELSRATSHALALIHPGISDDDDEFERNHHQLANYNGCHLYSRIENTDEYEYLELIPSDRLCNATQLSIDDVKIAVEELSLRDVIMPCGFTYDSEHGEIWLRFKSVERAQILERGVFERTQQGIAQAVSLASEAYKKGREFRNVIHKAPLLTLTNLAVDVEKCTVYIRTIGRSLSVPLVVSGQQIGEDEAEIARMVGFLLCELCFDTDESVTAFLKESHHTPAGAFLSQLILNLCSREPTYRHGVVRFAHLSKAFAACRSLPAGHVAIFHLGERLKTVLYRKNSRGVSWYGACATLNVHVLDARVMIHANSVRDVGIKNKTFGDGSRSNGFHRLSRDLLNAARNLDLLRRLDLK